MNEHEQTSPRPPRMLKPPEAGWEFAAIPWAFPLDEAQTLTDGWEPLGVAYVTNHETPEQPGSCCVIVRRPA